MAGGGPPGGAPPPAPHTSGASRRIAGGGRDECATDWSWSSDAADTADAGRDWPWPCRGRISARPFTSFDAAFAAAIIARYPGELGPEKRGCPPGETLLIVKCGGTA